MSDAPEEEEESEVESSSEEVDSPTLKRVRGTAKSGWCLEFNPEGHTRCPRTVNSFTCTCPCHTS